MGCLILKNAYNQLKNKNTKVSNILSIFKDQVVSKHVWTTGNIKQLDCMKDFKKKLIIKKIRTKYKLLYFINSYFL